MGLKDVAKEIGTELYPAWQAGLNDAHQMLKAFPESLTPSSVLGQAGMPTPGEVDRAMNADDLYGRGEPADWREQYSPDAWAGYERDMAASPEPEVTSADVDRMYEAELSRQEPYEPYLDLSVRSTPEPEREPAMELER